MKLRNKWIKKYIADDEINQMTPIKYQQMGRWTDKIWNEWI